MSSTNIGKTKRVEIELGSDWSRSGKLLFAKDRKLFRLAFGKTGELPCLDDAELLIDLSDRTFEPRASKRSVRHAHDPSEKHMDYMRWNPVKQGYVKRVSNWRYSSFHHFVEQGGYTSDWVLPPAQGEPFAEGGFGEVE
ncbi:MAG: hypothetical protein HY308_08060 [Gammaproteobacteria bacterium]|nr:hypothetical protein [Gammaproteobacteria bacterium]